MVDFRLYAISNRMLVSSLADFVREACESGLRAFQLREKDMSSQSLCALAHDIRSVAPACKLFINDRADIAIASNANGIHLPESSWPVQRLHQSFPSLQCGVSVHSLDAAQQAERDGADFIVFGPIFDTPSKQSLGMDARGLASLRELSNAVTVPIFAIGGITPQRAHECREHGAWGVAVMRDLIAASDVRARLIEYREAMGTL